MLRIAVHNGGFIPEIAIAVKTCCSLTVGRIGGGAFVATLFRDGVFGTSEIGF
jgi:hypothetical protein